MLTHHLPPTILHNFSKILGLQAHHALPKFSEYPCCSTPHKAQFKINHTRYWRYMWQHKKHYVIQLRHAFRSYQSLYRTVVAINERLNEASLAPSERLFKPFFVTVQILPGKRRRVRKNRWEEKVLNPISCHRLSTGYCIMLTRSSLWYSFLSLIIDPCRVLDINDRDFTSDKVDG